MSHPKTETIDGKERHFSVGAVIERNGKYLLIDRVNPPYGFACPAGHVDEGETSEAALRREVKEETGLSVAEYTLLYEEYLDWNQCSHGINIHYWYLYSCETYGELVLDEREAKSVDWYTPDELKTLTLELVWEYWFKKLGII